MSTVALRPQRAQKGEDMDENVYRLLTVSLMVVTIVVMILIG